MARLTKALRARIDLLPPAERATVMQARRAGYRASLDEAGNIILTPRASRPRKKRKPQHLNHPAGHGYY